MTGVQTCALPIFKDALKAYELIFRRTSKLDSLMSAKGKVSELPRNLYCQRLSFDKLKTQDLSCIKAGLNLANIPSMPQKNKDFLLKKFQNDPAFRKRIEILINPNILTGMLNSDAQTFASIYRALRANQRTQILNQDIKPIAPSVAINGSLGFCRFGKRMGGAPGRGPGAC